MHAERDIVMANPSVRLSIRLSLSLSHCGNVSKGMHISSNSFRPLVGGITVVFLALPPLQNSKGPKGELPQRSDTYTGVEKLAS